RSMLLGRAGRHDDRVIRLQEVFHFRVGHLSKKDSWSLHRCFSPRLLRVLSSAMQLAALDWVVIAITLVVCFAPSLFFGRRAGRNTSEFFVSGRAVPWWLAGLSMVATTFSSDTPNLVTDIVRRNGVAGNWVWWA